jgi:hypothetical protein
MEMPEQEARRNCRNDHVSAIKARLQRRLKTSNAYLGHGLAAVLGIDCAHCFSPDRWSFAVVTFIIGLGETASRIFSD